MKVIHGSYTEDTKRSEFKTCPVCGAVCFEDMDVCYGCLHNFNEDKMLTQKDPIEGHRIQKPLLEPNAPEPASTPIGTPPNEASTKHVCIDDEGRKFEITILIKML